MSQAALGFVVARHMKDKDLQGDEYSTPRKEFSAIDLRYAFKRDVCAASWSAKCTQFWTAEDDALAQKWDPTEGAYWMNPPYSRGLIDRFMAAGLAFGIAGGTCVALVFNKSDTQWWHKNVRRPRNVGQLLHITPRVEPWGLAIVSTFERVRIAVTELEGRLEFQHESGGATEVARFPSVVVAWEPVQTSALEA